MSNTKMIYNDDQSIGVDVESFQKLEAIVESILNGHNNSEDEQWVVTLQNASIKIQEILLLTFVTMTCSISPTIAIM